MIDKFEEWLEGKFNNRIQAFTHPSRYAYIVVQHRKVGDHLFYGEQAYFNKLNTPYRQFILQESEKDGTIVVKNYEVPDKSRYLGFKNLNELADLNLTYKVGCDTIFRYYNDIGEKFAGEIQPGCQCKVDWAGQETYLNNNAVLTDSCYNVEDKGHDPATHQQVWGSRYGQFMFNKVPL